MTKAIITDRFRIKVVPKKIPRTGLIIVGVLLLLVVNFSGCWAKDQSPSTAIQVFVGSAYVSYVNEYFRLHPQIWHQQTAAQGSDEKEVLFLVQDRETAAAINRVVTIYSKPIQHNRYFFFDLLSNGVVYTIVSKDFRIVKNDWKCAFDSEPLTESEIDIRPYDLYTEKGIIPATISSFLQSAAILKKEPYTIPDLLSGKYAESVKGRLSAENDELYAWLSAGFLPKADDYSGQWYVDRNRSGKEVEVK